MNNKINDLDYKKLGLMCGLEIHQRLNTNKLFCDCPSILREDKPHFTIRREMRAVAGETGKVDDAARHESTKHEYYNYEGYNDTTCLVELDEEPPHEMNKEALKVVLQFAKMLNAKIADEVQVMRKTVVNGSNTSGFQRTALVAYKGQLNVDGKKVGVPTIMIEEDSAKDIEKGLDKDGKRFVTYRLDRLGIPLIEIGTDPDIDSPEMCKQTSELIGMMLRSTGKVARGIGTIRQDINVSISSGARVEIKGAQDLKMIPTWVEYEARRQMVLSEVMNKIIELNPNFDNIIDSDVTKVFTNTECKFVKKAIDNGAKAIAFKLDKMNGILGIETQPGKRIGSELSDYAKAKTGIGGMIHSDEDMNKYKFTKEEINSVRKNLNIDDKDNSAFVIIVAEEEKARRAMKFAIERVKMLNQGVIKEVRKPNPDGTSSFMRPIPGAARMYPETDIKPIKPDYEKIELPELLTDKQKRYEEKYGLSSDLARDITRSGMFDLFEKFANNDQGLKASYVGDLIVGAPRNIRRKYNIETTMMTEDKYKELFTKLESGEITKDVVEDIMVAMCKGKTIDYSQYKPMDDSELESEIRRIIEENSGGNPKAIIGKVMGALKGKAEGRKIMELFNKIQK